jgi:hypothetical protein
MKKLAPICLLALLECFLPIASNSQTAIPINQIAVGDTLLLDSGTITVGYGGSCPIVGFEVSYNDSSNFFVFHSISNGTAYYWIYFTPRVSGVFHGKFHLAWYVSTSRCPLSGSDDKDYYCETPRDSSQILLKPYVYKTHLAVDTAKEIVYGQFLTILHNYSGRQLTIDSVRYFGSKPESSSFFLDSAMSSKPIVLPADSTDDSLSIFILSKEGPGLTVDAYARIYEHIGNNEHIDTLLLTFSSDPFCCPQANFIGQFYKNGLQFVLTSGETLDTAAIIVYSKFVTNFSIDSLTYPFSLTVEDKPLIKILHLRYHPILHDTNFTDLNISYSIRYFNGETVHFNSHSDYNFMHLFLYWVAFMSDVRQNNLQDTVLRIVPNPAHKTITVSLANIEGSYDVAIFNSAGNLLKTERVNSLPSQIDVSGLSPGSYYLQARTQKRVYLQKFLIE